MASVTFDEFRKGSHRIVGSEELTITFASGVSAADARLGRGDEAFAARLSVEGESVRMIDPRTSWIGTFPLLYDLGSPQFGFEDGSQMLFANRWNGYTTLLQGSKQDDLLVGSTAGAETPLTLLSKTADGTPGNGSSSGGILSREGDIVLYASTATNLAGASSSAVPQIYAVNPSWFSGRISVAPDGSPGDDESWGPSISNDGRTVVYMSRADNLGQGTGFVKVLAVDMKFPDLGTSTLNLGLDGAAPNGDSDSAKVASDGNATVYRSLASNLVANDSNGQADIFVLHNGVTERVSMSTSGAQANGDNAEPFISANGRYVVFRSDANNLVGGDDNNQADIFVRDLEKNTTTLMSPGAQFRSQDPAISEDGKVVAFYSFDDFGLTGDTSGQHANLFVVHTARPNVIEVASADAQGVPRGISVDVPASGDRPALSGDGRFIAFSTTTPGLVKGDSGSSWDVFVKDMHTGAIERIDMGRSGGSGSSPSISADGSKISFAYTESMPALWQTYVVDNPLYSAELRGGAGNDTYQITRGGDVIVERANGGTDLVSASVSFVLPAHVENLELTGSARNGTGNGLDNVLAGNARANLLDGGAGRDTMSGGKGNDHYVVDHRGDVVRELAGGGTDSVQSSVSYVLSKPLENLSLTGSKDIDATGNAAANVIVGNRGDNLIDAKGGADRISTGRGNDVVLIGSASGSDTISDFSSKTDHLKFDAGRLDLGDGDARLEGATTRGAAGRFSTGAELVLFTEDSAGSLSARAAAKLIGSARSDYERGDKRLFVVDDGDDTAVFLFTSSGHDARVSAGELALLATLQNSETVIGDYLFGA